MDGKPNSLKYVSILYTWRKFIIINTISALLLSIIISVLLPNWYKATTSLLSPKQPDLLSNLSATSSVLKGISGLSKLGGLGQKSNSYNYFAILKSRTTMEKVVQKFDLITVYDTPDRSLEKTIKELSENTRFEEGEDDNIIIDVFDKDPNRAAEMSNYFLEVLNEVNTRIGTLEARNNREFMGQRLQEANQMLYKAEEELRKYQEKSGLIITSEQSSGVDAVASLYVMKLKKELEYSILKQSVSADNNALQQIHLELNELQKKVSTIPQTGIASLRLYREVIIQQKIVEFLVPLYEQSRIEEQKDVPVLLVLDKAVKPERKTKPQRSLIVLISTFSILAFSIAMVFFMQSIKNMTNTENFIVESKLHFLVDRITNFYRMFSERS
jgi:tyrosine-protein kinase Etk/Wzc